MEVIQTSDLHKPAVAVCCQWRSDDGRRLVTIAVDDSCGAFTSMRRSEIRCWTGSKFNVNSTDECFPEAKGYSVWALPNEVARAMMWLEPASFTRIIEDYSNDFNQ